MDLTNGHSEKNPRNEEIENFLNSLKNNGEIKKLSIEDMSLEEREFFYEMIDEAGLDEEPEVFSIEFTVTDLSTIPVDLLIELLSSAIAEDRYEDAKDINEAIKKQGYVVDFSENSISLVENK